MARNRQSEVFIEEAVLATEYDVNEKTYILCNPVVFAAINHGKFSSARQHFGQYGRHEGRRIRVVVGRCQPDGRLSTPLLNAELMFLTVGHSDQRAL